MKIGSNVLKFLVQITSKVLIYQEQIYQGVDKPENRIQHFPGFGGKRVLHRPPPPTLLYQIKCWPVTLSYFWTAASVTRCCSKKVAQMFPKVAKIISTTV